MSASAGTDSTVREFRRSLRQQLQRLDRPLPQIQAACFDLTVQNRGLLVRLDPRHEERVPAHEIQHREALLALADQVM